MLFNSFEYIIFLPIVFLLYWYVFKSLKWQNFLVAIVSYIFYGWWNWNFLILIFTITICSYFSGIYLEKYNNKQVRKYICIGNIILNLLILGYYKYYNFFGENLFALLSKLGFNVDWVTLKIVLPVGISFYTFQALSYTIDVYKKNIKPTHDIISFISYISFFPQLVAGPIERATNLLPQFSRTRNFDYAMAVDGMRQILWGAFKKMVVADNCAIVVDNIFTNYDTIDGCNLLIGGILFTFQIYGDFSGYSDIAIGTAKLFGIRLMQNFNYPYFSRDIAEFWRKWHISLQTWFRDYIYIPMGGSKTSKCMVIRNTLVVFIISGFWHGANWTFILWGVYHACLFIPLLLLGLNRKYTDVVAINKKLPTLKESLQMLFTFLFVIIGWIIFRSDNVSQAFDYLSRIFTDFNIAQIDYKKKVYVFILILLLVEWFHRKKQHGLQLSMIGLFRYTLFRYCFYICLGLFTLMFAGMQAEFIYFQF